MGQTNSKRKIGKLFIELIEELSFYNSNLLIKLEAIELLTKFQEGNLKPEDMENILSHMKNPPRYLSERSITRCRELTRKIMELI